jgi:hypothetical protein
MKTSRNSSLLLVVIAATSLFFFLARVAIGDPPQKRLKSGWTEIRRASSWQGIEFEAQREVWLVERGSRTRLISLADPDENYDSEDVSPLDPSGRYQVLMAVDDFRPGWLIDRRGSHATRLPLPHWMQDFAAWSPDQRYVILHTSYEDSDQLWVLRLADLQVREVHRGSLRPGIGECCGLDDWATQKGELGAADEKSVRWLDASRFSFALYTFCSPYENVKSGPCALAATGDKELAAFVVTVDVESGKVIERRVAAHGRRP